MCGCKAPAQSRFTLFPSAVSTQCLSPCSGDTIRAEQLHCMGQEQGVKQATAMSQLPCGLEGGAHFHEYAASVAIGEND